MSRSLGLARIDRHEDGTATAEWAGHELKTAFQPIFAFRSGKLDRVAFECLLRPFREGESIHPTVFFAEVPGRDRFAVETLSRTLHLINAGASLGDHASIFINFDPSVFTDRALVDIALRDMRIVLHEAMIDPRRIVCEVTEQRSHSQEALYAFVSALRTHGFRIAVDDYGSEESDMERIKSLRPDIVKFDARWISRLMDTGAGFALLTTMVEAFDGQGIVTVFEGIEEGWQVELAEKSGASMVQGHALARPELAPASFLAMMRQEASAAEPHAHPRNHAPHPAHPFGRRGR